MTLGKPVIAALRETISCARFSLRISRESCGRQWRVSSTTGSQTQRAEGLPAKSTACRDCDIGAAHARGQLHSPTPSVGAVVPAADLTRKLAPRFCLVCGDPMPKRHALARRQTCSHACSSEFLRNGNVGARIDVEHDTSGYDGVMPMRTEWR